MYLFSLHAVTVILTWEAPRNYCRLLSALSGYCKGCKGEGLQASWRGVDHAEIMIAKFTDSIPV